MSWEAEAFIQWYRVSATWCDTFIPCWPKVWSLNRETSRSLLKWKVLSAIKHQASSLYMLPHCKWNWNILKPQSVEEILDCNLRKNTLHTCTSTFYIEWELFQMYFINPAKPLSLDEDLGIAFYNVQQTVLGIRFPCRQNPLLHPFLGSTYDTSFFIPLSDRLNNITFTYMYVQNWSQEDLPYPSSLD